MKRLNVTCAIIIENGMILACQRGPGSDQPFLWEFPGGKVETGESNEACIVREIWEELSVEIAVIRPLRPFDHNYPEKNIRLFPFLCQRKSGLLTCKHHEAMTWFRLDRFEELNWSEADRLFIESNFNEFCEICKL